MLLWEEIMKNSPTMKQLIEEKITSEIEPVKVENAALKAEIESLKQQIETTNP